MIIAPNHEIRKEARAMSKPNVALCNDCRRPVPAEFFFQNGEVWIRKDCPACGPSAWEVSSDAGVWQAKRDLWNGVPMEPRDCGLHCDRCQKNHSPNVVFVDVTNRCNMDCPICIAKLGAMGFDFNPPMKYFEHIFAEIAKIHPKPAVQLFGGEPTVRDDLPEILRIAYRHGLQAQLTTNGIRFADEEYCKEFCRAPIGMRFSLDGLTPDVYARLRNNPRACRLKLQALDNLKKYYKRRLTIISCAGKGINDASMAELIQYCHDNRDLISDLGIIPLAQDWEPGQFEAEARTTMEDVEKMVDRAVPDGGVEFIPAGLSYWLRKPRSFFRDNPHSEVLLLAGVHPNCESFSFLISDGRQYRGINYYMKRPFAEAVVDLIGLLQKIDPKLSRLDPKKYFQRWRGRLLIIMTVLPWMLRTFRFRRFAGGNLLLGILKGVGNLLVRKFHKRFSKDVMKRRRPAPMLRIAVLPFEEQNAVDAARMENCKAVFAYEDVENERIGTIPVCLWYPFRNPILEKITAKYGTISCKTRRECEAPVGVG
jgi:MoaA/NifB/PqqE/SkfB family radical SAM enzyme